MAVYVDLLAKNWNPTVSNPYKQHSQKEVNRNVNLGLGLAISRQLVELTQAQIDLKPEGQLFTVIINMPFVAENLNGQHSKQ